jgi:hypothetical protein
MHSTKSECGGKLKHSIDEFHRSNPTSEDEEVKATFGLVSSSSSKSDSGGNTGITGINTRVTS